MSQSPPERQLLWLRRLRDLSAELAAERDPAALPTKILDAAIELADAERGFLVLLEEAEGRKPRLKVPVARGFDRTSLQAGQGKVSRTVISRVLEEERAVVTSQEEDRDLKDVTSIVERRVRSIAAVPLCLRGRVLGALYLDHRFDHQAFTNDDLPCLEAFADQAALALESADLHAGRRAQSETIEAALAELEGLRSDRPAGLPKDPDALPRFGALLGGSPCMQEVYALIERAARSFAPVLITGESGTGKELVAKELHRRSEAADQPFLSLSCAAMPDGLLSSELFGHRRGSFTGADRDYTGLLQQAGRGVLFLDGVGDMSLAMQAKLLRVLQERVVRPVGAADTAPLECRVIVAAKKNLSQLVTAGSFREDLFYRLDVLRISLPPLRERRGDIPHLLAHLLRRESAQQPELTAEALSLLVAYAWPGNVRELENEVWRLSALGLPVLTEEHLSPELRGPTRQSPQTLAEVEKEMLEEALRETGGNKSQAARRLGLARSSFYAMLKKYGLG